MLLLSMLLLGVATRASPTDNTDENLITQDSTKALAEAINSFALRFYQTLPAQTNVFFSPVSIATAISMVYLGANSTTAEEIESSLGLDSAGLAGYNVHQAFQKSSSPFASKSRKYRMDVANAVLVQKDFDVQQRYKEDLKRFYRATLEQVDFATEGEAIRTRINEWVSTQTNKQISEFLAEPPDAASRLVLLNANYFKGLWRRPFNVNDTKMQPFYGEPDGNSTLATMMHFYSKKFRCFFDNELEAKFLELPYKGKNVSMVLVVPFHVDQLAEVESRLNPAKLQLSLSKMKNQFLDIAVPKFHMRYSSEITSNLESLNMAKMFDPQQADLSGISAEEGLYVSSVIHEAAVDVNEEGSQASGASGVEITPLSIPPRIIADRPFIFFIRCRKTGMVLFMGRMQKPEPVD